MDRSLGSLDNNTIVHLVMVSDLESFRERDRETGRTSNDVEGFQKMSSTMWFPSGLDSI